MTSRPGGARVAGKRSGSEISIRRRTHDGTRDKLDDVRRRAVRRVRDGGVTPGPGHGTREARLPGRAGRAGAAARRRRQGRRRHPRALLVGLRAGRPGAGPPAALDRRAVAARPTPGTAVDVEAGDRRGLIVVAILVGRGWLRAAPPLFIRLRLQRRRGRYGRRPSSLEASTPR